MSACPIHEANLSITAHMVAQQVTQRGPLIPWVKDEVEQLIAWMEDNPEELQGKQYRWHKDEALLSCLSG